MHHDTAATTVIRVGVDVGGTFTDLVLWQDGWSTPLVHKVPSTPANPAEAITRGLDAICGRAGIPLSDIGLVLHGTTVATNILIERNGAALGLVTTEGFRDILHIARKKRPLTFSSYQDVPWQAAPLVRRVDRIAVRERVHTRTGTVETPLDEQAVRDAARHFRARGVDAVAVCFLGSFVNPAHEQRAEEILRDELPGVFLCTSSDVVPLYREYERFNTTVVNAYVGPRTSRYLESLDASLAERGMRRRVRLMASSGGMVGSETAQRLPVTLLMSGPAAGLIAGRESGRSAGESSVITLDVGGTSSDIGIVPRGQVRMKHLLDTKVRDQAVMVPMVEVETIGAGGGSIASVRDGVLSVGPRSAGAAPGPACYGLGGAEATATDAAVTLGWIRPDVLFAGELQLDAAAARQAVAGRVAAPLSLDVDTAALGIHTVLAHNMAAAIRLLSERRGFDPRDFMLVAQGGAGPLFACAVAELSGVRRILMPAHPGLASAIGLLNTDLRYEFAATVWERLSTLDAARLQRELHRLRALATAQLDADGIAPEARDVEVACDCRYGGQGYELRIAAPGDTVDRRWVDAVAAGFHKAHEETYGRSFAGQEVHVVNVRVVGVGRLAAPAVVGEPNGHGLRPAPVRATCDAVFGVGGRAQRMATQVIRRSDLLPGHSVVGPSVVEQMDSTLVIPPGFHGSVDRVGNIVVVQEGHDA